VSENDGGALRLVLSAPADSQSVLRAAFAAGPVTEFAVQRRRLSEVFREAVTHGGGQRQAATEKAGVQR
jgi:ABC-2 type transport system ATP-binding protein